jgi:hypothetical protein
LASLIAFLASCALRHRFGLGDAIHSNDHRDCVDPCTWDVRVSVAFPEHRYAHGEGGPLFSKSVCYVKDVVIRRVRIHSVYEHERNMVTTRQL